jgi:hypothetical protein
MNTKARNIALGLVLSLSGGLLAMGSLAPSSGAAAKTSVGGDVQAASASVERFAGNAHHCRAFAGAQGVGTDGVSAEFSTALSDAIRANGGDLKRTLSMIRERCKAVA